MRFGFMADSGKKVLEQQVPIIIPITNPVDNRIGSWFMNII